METGQTLIKIMSVGDAEVGKSCLIKRYCEGRFINRYITTIGVDYGVKKLNIKGQKVSVSLQSYQIKKINFFDLSGDQSYADIRNEFIADAQGILLVFDLSKKESFQNLEKWEKVLKKQDPDYLKQTVFLIGCKSDLKNKDVDKQDIDKFCKSRNIEYFTTSANNGENVNEVFDALFNKVLQKQIDFKAIYSKN